MTRTQKGPNGEQQRVTFERDFKNETELNKFLKDFELNLNKNQYASGLGAHYRPTSAASTQPGGTTTNGNTNPADSHMRTSSLDEELIKSPGCVLSLSLSLYFSLFDSSLTIHML